MLTEEKRNRINQLLKELVLEVQKDGPLLKPTYDEERDSFEFGLKIMCPFAVTYEYLDRAKTEQTQLAYLVLEEALLRTIKNLDSQVAYVRTKIKSGRHSHD